METLIGLLVILLPVIFKAIGKRLEEAGKEGPAAKMRELSEAFDSDENSLEPEPESQTIPMQVEPLPIKVKPVTPVRVQSVEKKEPILIEEEEKKGEKIDPKKLVIYSEIMQPKYKN